MGDFDGLGGAVAAGGVDEAFFDRGVAGQVGGRVAVGGGFGALGPAQGQGQGQVHHGVTGVGRDVEGRRRGVGGGEVERRAVGQHAPGRRQGDLAGAEGGLVDLEVGEAPEQAASGPAARLDIPFGVPVLLLEMLGPQEQPLRPHDFAVPGHGGFRDQVDGRPSGAAFRGTGG